MNVLNYTPIILAALVMLGFLWLVIADHLAAWRTRRITRQAVSHITGPGCRRVPRGDATAQALEAELQAMILHHGF